MTLEGRVTALETELSSTKEMLKLVLYKLRETDIMELAEIERVLGLKRSIPTREERNREYQASKHASKATTAGL